MPDADTAPPAAPPVIVSPAQVWSSAAQNIVIAACITYAYLVGKCPQEIWLLALGYIGGVDLLGRRLAKTSPAIAAAIGATGALAQVGRVITSFALVLLVVGCGDLSTIAARAHDTLDRTRATQMALVDAQARTERVVHAACDQPTPSPELDEVCRQAVKSLADARELLDSSISALRTAESTLDLLSP